MSAPQQITANQLEMS